MKIGSHVSNKAPEMLVGSLKEALSYNETSFMFYLGPPQSLYRKSYEELNGDLFKNLLKKHGFTTEDVIIHAPYIMNLAQPEEEKREFAVKVLTNELKLASECGLKYIVVHPGNSLHLQKEEAIKRIEKSLIEVFKNTKGDETVILLETMAGKGTEVCTKFEDIKYLLDHVNSERLKVCLDTCHTWDSGYDWKDNYEETILELDKVIGIKNIKCIHLNDSKNPLASHKDRHENIGHGFLGFETILKFAYDKRFENIPKILETPYIKKANGTEFPPYKEEIEMILTKQFKDIKK